MKKPTVGQIIQKKKQGEPIVILTAYDALWASLLRDSGVEIILVGDSVGMVLLGYETTTSVTMEEMIHHAKASRRGAPEAFLIGDMPFGSYHQTPQQSVANAFRFIREAGCDAVKIEWHSRVVEMVQAMVTAGIAVMGHVGLTPQTVSQLAGYKVQGRDPGRAKEILEGAMALEKAGCFSVVLECIPEQLAAEITRKLQVPTIGIGAGSKVDGQVLVTQDLLGLFDRFVPRFVKRYANLREEAVKAIQTFRQEVEEKKFPSKEHVFT